MLQERLQELSDGVVDGDSIQGHISFFADLYGCDDELSDGKFRHDYSQISVSLYEGPPPSNLDEVNAASRRAQMISSNIDQIYTAAENGQTDRRVLESLFKLKSHISLEMQHLTTISSVFSGMDTLQEQLESSKKELRSARKTLESDMDETKKQMQAMRRDYIAILGIFAAVVLVVNSSIGFTGSAISATAVHDSFANILLVILVVGFIAINLVIGLLGFIWKLVREESAKKPCSIIIFTLVVNVIILIFIFLLVSNNLWLISSNPTVG